jgi:antitoxin CcdA
VKRSPYNPDAPKRTVSLTMNADLFARAKALKINASRVCEAALGAEIARLQAERVRDEIRQDLVAVGAYIEKHGSFADMVRAHYTIKDDED